jgi:hypothetical protein
MALNMVLARHNIKKLLKQVRRQLLVIYLTYLRKCIVKLEGGGRNTRYQINTQL